MVEGSDIGFKKLMDMDIDKELHQTFRAYTVLKTYVFIFTLINVFFEIVSQNNRNRKIKRKRNM